MNFAGATPAGLPLGAGLPLAPGLPGLAAPGLVPGTGLNPFLAAPGADFASVGEFGGLPAAAGLPGLLAGGPHAFEPYHPGSFGLADTKSKLGKNSKQQAANKVSQQRYRERKKAKFTEMEETIAALQQRLHTLQALQKRNHLLETQTSELEARLVEQEREIEQLKFTLDQQSDRSMDPRMGQQAQQQQQQQQQPAPATRAAASQPAAAADADMAAVAANCGDSTQAAAVRASGGAAVCCAPLGKDLAELDFDAELEERVEELQRQVERHGLRQADPASVSPEVVEELAVLVGRCCQLRQAAMSAEGAKALALFDGRRKWVAALGADANAARWAEVLQALRLGDAQQEQLLSLRSTHLAKLRACYQERQDLNLEAMSLMLPRQSPLLQRDTTVEGRLASMSSRGYLATAKTNLELGELLDRVKDTIRREQREVMDLNSLAITQILTPVQASLFLALSYPELPDVLALIEALARRAGKAGLPGAACPACGHCSSQQQVQQQAQQPQQCGGGGGEAGEAAAAPGGACCPNQATARAEGVILSGGTSAGAAACQNCSACGEAPGCWRSDGCSAGENTAGTG